MQKAAELSQNDPATVPDRLLSAAEQVVSRDGVANLTLEAVAREAGVSKGGLLYHFPSKSALVTAIVERLARHCEAKQATSLEQDTNTPGAFTRAYVQTRTEPLAPHEVPFHCALLAAAGTDPQYLEPFRRRIAQWQTRLENDGIDPVIAVIARLAVDGLAFGTLLGLPVPQDQLREQVIQRLLEMTSKNESVKD